MNKHHKPLMMAYILFLLICSVYHIVSKAYSLEFANWNNIIVAATIASYFFSLNSMNKANLRTKREYEELFEKRQAKLKCYEDTLKFIYKENKQKSNYVDIIQKNDEIISSIKKEIKTLERKSFVFDVCGFLVFFCIMTFEGIYTYFQNLQDVATLMAFTMILLVEYIEPFAIEKERKDRGILYDSTLEVVESLEEFEQKQQSEIRARAEDEEVEGVLIYE